MTKSDKAVAYMYVLECSDGTLYTGYTTELVCLLFFFFFELV